MIVNGYKPGEGITSHVDLLKFDDGIAIVSLGSLATMTFTKADNRNLSGKGCTVSAPLHTELETVHQEENRFSCSSICPSAASENSLQCDIYLEPGDLLLMHGEARYTWKHGIGVQQPCSIACSVDRVSVTLRKLAVQ